MNDDSDMPQGKPEEEKEDLCEHEWEYIGGKFLQQGFGEAAIPLCRIFKCSKCGEMDADIVVDI